MRLGDLLAEIDAGKDRRRILERYGIRYTTLDELRASASPLAQQIMKLYHNNFII